MLFGCSLRVVKLFVFALKIFGRFRSKNWSALIMSAYIPFFVPIIKNGEEFSIRVCLIVCYFSAKSRITNNPWTGMSYT